MFLFFLCASASADDNELNDSEYDEEIPALPNYGPELFEEIKNDPRFIAARGTMPEIGKEEEEKQKWINLLTNCSGFSDLPFKIDPYMRSNGGSVVTFGCSGMGGYLYVEFDKNTPENINESIIDEIYQIIEDHCEKEGINEVPVVFIWGEVAIEDRGGEKGADGETTTRQTPGFTSIMVILGLLSLLVFKR